MLRDSPAVSPSNSYHKGERNEYNSIGGVEERNKSEWTVIEALMGMGSGQMKDDESINVDDEVESEDDCQEDTA